MAVQLLLNLVIAVVWMFLNDNWTASGFIVGFLIGAITIGLMRRFWPQPYYLIRLWAVVKLLALFMKELIVSSYAVLVHIVRPKLTIRPGIFAYKTELKSDWEVTVLSCLICLTPGTLTMDVSRDGGTLYIHAMDIDDVEELSRQIKGSFEKAIMEVTRSC
ncbi:Na+/H+ antiporter subunit E [Paenibacillus harenae]|uniref:Multicomponent Na+:H+ antiporter subunit E n=1 Tax=Paenibacillus harenae TaxID=306543 RepID=A0ABT9U1R2_PAEHA|nr:Na+/H+ antiporter subunit E [Paenibacillus harenae]MDQ0113187.1 multicomponent Na+:H+ antiporter subunit E [Paenibacillus harenae]